MKIRSNKYIIRNIIYNILLLILCILYIIFFKYYNLLEEIMLGIAFIYFLSYVVVTTLRFKDTYINFTDEYVEISMIKIIKARNFFDMYIDPTSKVKGGKYGSFSYEGILKNRKYIIYYSDIKKIDYVKELNYITSGSYPIERYPFDIGIITNKKRYFIAVNQYFKKQSNLIYEELLNKIKN